MKLVSNLVNSIPIQNTTLVSILSILAVFGPFISVSGGFWDAVNHLVNDPEFFGVFNTWLYMLEFFWLHLLVFWV